MGCPVAFGAEAAEHEAEPERVGTRPLSSLDLSVSEECIPGFPRGRVGSPDTCVHPRASSNRASVAFDSILVRTRNEPTASCRHPRGRRSVETAVPAGRRVAVHRRTPVDARTLRSAPRSLRREPRRRIRFLLREAAAPTGSREPAGQTPVGRDDVGVLSHREKRYPGDEERPDPQGLGMVRITASGGSLGAARGCPDRMLECQRRVLTASLARAAFRRLGDARLVLLFEARTRNALDRSVGVRRVACRPQIRPGTPVSACVVVSAVS